jgi:hypothetical protein
MADLPAISVVTSPAIDRAGPTTVVISAALEPPPTEEPPDSGSSDPLARPAVSELAERVYKYLAPLTFADHSLDWPLLTYVEGQCRSLQRIYNVVKDRPDRPGWAILFDPDHLDFPPEAIRWLGQFVGVRLAANMDFAVARSELQRKAGFRRGSPDAIKEAVRATLDPATPRSVYVVERQSGSAWRAVVATLREETPDPEAAEKAAMSQKPMGVVMTYSLITGGTWSDLIATHATWADVKSDFPTWRALIDDPSKT